MAPNTQQMRTESNKFADVTGNVSPVAHSDLPGPAMGEGMWRAQPSDAYYRGQGGGGNRGGGRRGSARGRGGGGGYGGHPRVHQPPQSMLPVMHTPPPVPLFHQPQMQFGVDPSLGFALPMMPVGRAGGTPPPPGMAAFVGNGQPLPSPPFFPPPPHCIFNQPLFMPQQQQTGIFLPPPQQSAPPPHYLHGHHHQPIPSSQPPPVRAPGRLLFSPPSPQEPKREQAEKPQVVAEATKTVEETQPIVQIVQPPPTRAKTLLFDLDSKSGLAVARPKDERVVVEEPLAVVESRDVPQSVASSPGSRPPTAPPSPPPAIENAPAAVIPSPPASTTPSRHSSPPASPVPVADGEEEDSASEEELGEVDEYLQSVYDIIAETRPNMAEKAYNDEFLIAMRDLIRKESGWTGVGCRPNRAAIPASPLSLPPAHTPHSAPRPLPPPAASNEKAARPWTNHPLPAATQRPGVGVPLDFNREVMRARKQAKAVERSENAWAPERAVVGDAEPAPVDEKLCKAIRRILNKITPTTYEELADAFCAKKIHAESNELLGVVVDMIFEKAVEEKDYCPLYADLCKKQSDEEKSTEDRGKFLRALVRKCQVAFERDVQHIEEDEEAEPKTAEEKEEEERRAKETEKKRVIGTITLIARLYERSCISSIVMSMCAVDIVRRYIDERDEAYVEYAIKMFEVVGSKFHEETTSRVKRGDSEMKEVLGRWDAAYSSVVRAKPNLSSRVRFLVINLEELKGRSWQGAGCGDMANRPKTIEQLDREAEEQERECERKRMEFNERRPRHGGPPRRGGGPGARFSPQLPGAHRPHHPNNGSARPPSRSLSPERHKSPLRSAADQQRRRDEEMREKRMKAGLASTKAGGGGGVCGGGAAGVVADMQRISLSQANKSATVSFGGARPSPFARKWTTHGTKTTEQLTSTNWRQRDTAVDGSSGDNAGPADTEGDAEKKGGD